MIGHTIKNVKNPFTASDAANKLYIDSKISSSNGNLKSDGSVRMTKLIILTWIMFNMQTYISKISWKIIDQDAVNLKYLRNNYTRHVDESMQSFQIFFSWKWMYDAKNRIIGSVANPTANDHIVNKGFL